MQNAKSSETKLQLEENITSILTQYKSNQLVEFASLLFDVRNKLNDLYLQINRDNKNIEDIGEQYVKLLTAFSVVMQNNKIYNQSDRSLFKTTAYCDGYEHNFENKQRDPLNTQQEYFKIKSKLLRIDRNCNIMEQKLTNYKDLNKQNITQYTSDPYRLQMSPINLNEARMDFRELMFEYHYLIMETIDNILWLYAHDIDPKVTDDNINNPSLYNDYIEFLKFKIQKNFYVEHNNNDNTANNINNDKNIIGHNISSSEKINVSRPIQLFLADKYEEMRNFHYSNYYTYKISERTLINKYLSSIVSLCYLYDDVDSMLYKVIKDLINSWNRDLSLTPGGSYDSKLKKILTKMSRELKTLYYN